MRRNVSQDPSFARMADEDSVPRADQPFPKAWVLRRTADGASEGGCPCRDRGCHHRTVGLVQIRVQSEHMLMYKTKQTEPDDPLHSVKCGRIASDFI